MSCCKDPCWYLQVLVFLFFFSLMGLVSSHLTPHVSQSGTAGPSHPTSVRIGAGQGVSGTFVLKVSQGSPVLTEVGTPRPWAFVLNLGAKGPWPPPPA